MLDDQWVSISNMARQLNMPLQLVAQNMPLVPAVGGTRGNVKSTCTEPQTVLSPRSYGEVKLQL